MNRELIRTTVLRLLVEELDLEVRAEDLSEDDPLFAPHIRLDSISYLSFMSRLVEELELAEQASALEETVFETVGDIVEAVWRRRAS